jgi:hypothetical protein
MPWVIEVITHRDNPPGAPQLTYGRLVGLADDLPPDGRVGERFGPITAADRHGDLWQVPVAVVTGVAGPLAAAATVGPFRRFPDPTDSPVLGRWPSMPAVTPVLALIEPGRGLLRARRQRPWCPSPN